MDNSTLNSTVDASMGYKLSLKKASDILVPFTLCFIMFAMGADIKFKQILNHLRLPVGVLIGMACQFFVMPLIGFSLSQALGLEGPSVLGILLVSCCPGGALSNVFTYYLDGDIPLSVTMTSLSTLLGLGFLPFNFWMYGNWVETGSLVIPFRDMAVSLAFVTIPAAVGILLKWKYPKFAMYVTKIGSFIGLFMVVLGTVIYNVLYPTMLGEASWHYWVAVFVMPSAGFIFGYLLALVFRRTTAVCKTIAVESGVQNVAIAVSVLALSPFTYEEHKSVVLYPVMYGIVMTVLGVVVGLFYQTWKRFCSPEENEKKGNVTVISLQSKGTSIGTNLTLSER